jgi:proteic killer suppression protein
MIKSWQHKGLKEFFLTGSKKGIMPVHEKRLKIILQRLNAAIQAEDMNTPGMNFHELKGDLKGFYAVSVSGNWRVIFEFEDNDAHLLDYLDYH